MISVQTYIHNRNLVDTNICINVGAGVFSKDLLRQICVGYGVSIVTSGNK